MRKAMPRQGSAMWKLIQHVLTELFVAERRRLDKNITEIIMANNECHGVVSGKMLYEGETYASKELASFNQGGATPPTHDVMMARMADHVADAKKIADDNTAVSMAVFRLASDCEDLQSIRDSLPNCIVNMVPSLMVLPRTREVGYLLADDERAMRQVEEVLPIIELYSAMRLVY